MINKNLPVYSMYVDFCSHAPTGLKSHISNFECTKKACKCKIEERIPWEVDLYLHGIFRVILTRECDQKMKGNVSHLGRDSE